MIKGCLRYILINLILLIIALQIYLWHRMIGVHDTQSNHMNHVPHQPTNQASTQETKYKTLYETNQTSFEQLYPNFLRPPFQKIWRYSNNIPEWAKDYFDWHEDQRKLINGTNYKRFRFLVVICQKNSFKKCNGLSDRLQPMAFFLRLAYTSRRLLFWHWESPVPLTHLLMPPQGGMDWRVPPEIVPKLQLSPRTAPQSNLQANIRGAFQNAVFFKTRLISEHHGQDWYIQQADTKGDDDDRSYERHYRDLWYTLFTPVPALEHRIRDTMNALMLNPGAYGSIHLRALYDRRKARDTGKLWNMTQKMVDCMATLRPGPFYFASDAHEARSIAVDYGRSHETTIRARANDTTKVDASGLREPHAHLDLLSSSDPTDYYDILVDLYILSLGRCMTHSRGGFGRFAALLSGYDENCRRLTKFLGACPERKFWGDQKADSTGNQALLPQFLPPMM